MRQKFIIKPEKSNFSCCRKFEPELKDAVFYFESLFPFRVGAIKLCFCTEKLLDSYCENRVQQAVLQLTSIQFHLYLVHLHLYIYINHNINTVR